MAKITTQTIATFSLKETRALACENPSIRPVGR